jgi:3-hydroxyisobutyrate dehydrogenase
VDAPVSGGVNAAAAGTLTFMVGADSEAAFATAKQILESMGAKVRFRRSFSYFRHLNREVG